MVLEVISHGCAPELGDRERPGDVVMELAGAVVAGDRVDVLEGVDVTIRAGEVLGVLGSPATAPAALLAALAGELRLRRGALTYAGMDVTRVPAWRRVKIGIVRTTGGGRLVSGTVRDNVHAELRRQGHAVARCTVQRLAAASASVQSLH